jgi:hypothetical protein
MLSPCRSILLCVIVVAVVAAFWLCPRIELDGDRGVPDTAAREGDDYQTAILRLGWQDPLEEARWRALCSGVLQRGLAKGRLAADVAAGRLTLLEAAAGFRELNSRWPPFDWRLWRQFIHGRFSGVSDEEGLCRQVIGCAKSTLWQQPEKAEQVARRLEAELDQHLRHGTLRLPPVAGTGNVER